MRADAHATFACMCIQVDIGQAKIEYCYFACEFQSLATCIIWIMIPYGRFLFSSYYTTTIHQIFFMKRSIIFGVFWIIFYHMNEMPRMRYELSIYRSSTRVSWDVELSSESYFLNPSSWISPRSSLTSTTRKYH